jgi:hypothetical protein
MPATPPNVALGELVDGGLAPAILAIVDRGVRRKPRLASGLDAEVELVMVGHPPVRISFGELLVRVEDGASSEPDLRVSGALADLVALMVAPLVGGVPNPIDRRGRAAIGMVANGRIRVEGRLALLRRFIELISV